jgi:hypothetical protein
LFGSSEFNRLLSRTPDTRLQTDPDRFRPCNDTGFTSRHVSFRSHGRGGLISFSEGNVADLDQKESEPRGQAMRGRVQPWPPLVFRPSSWVWDTVMECDTGGVLGVSWGVSCWVSCHEGYSHVVPPANIPSYLYPPTVTHCHPLSPHRAGRQDGGALVSAAAWPRGGASGGNECHPTPPQIRSTTHDPRAIVGSNRRKSIERPAPSLWRAIAACRHF